MFSSAIVALFAFSEFSSISASCLHNTYLHRRTMEEEGGKVKLPKFGYAGLIGPTNWHALDQKNALCALGMRQSPINIEAEEIAMTEPGDVTLDIPADQELTFENLGTNVEVLLEGTTMVGDKKFKLKQFHYHTPSEHRISQEYFPVEVHMVHEAEANPEEIAVLTFIFQLAAEPAFPSEDPSAIFSNVLSSVSNISVAGDSVKLPGSSDQLSFAPLISTVPELSFFNYSGSLTTPPCSEGVTFLIHDKPLGMGVDTFNSLKQVVKFNSRFLQNSLGEPNLLTVSRNELNMLEGQECTVKQGEAIIPIPEK